ncbi:MAG: HDIG domain-containing protein [Thermoguttaceae bacterium]|nr:HDIG domain-containing protein [Thermoguttaceae bacterium]
MHFGQFRSKRDNYVASRIPKQSIFESLLSRMKNFQLGKRLLLCALTTLTLCLTIKAWDPPFIFTGGSRPNRDVVCMTPFSVENTAMTMEDRFSARFNTPHVYMNEPLKLVQFKEVLINRVKSILTSTSYEAMPDDEKAAWRLFLPENADDQQAEELFRKFKETLAEDQDLKTFKAAIDKAFSSYDEYGILLKLHPADEGNQGKIRVYNAGSSPDEAKEVLASDVLVGNMYPIKDSLNWDYSKEFSELIFNWINECAKRDVTDPTLPPLSTLTEDKNATVEAQRDAESRVPPHMVQYEKDKTIVRGGDLISNDILLLLAEEYKASIRQMPLREQLRRALGFFLVVFAATFLINVVLYFFEKTKYKDPQKENLKSSLVVYVLIVAVLLAGKYIQYLTLGRFGVMEIIPLLVFTQIIAVAFFWEIGFIVSLLLVLILSISSTNDIAPFLVMSTAMSLSSFLARDIRERTDVLCRSLTVMVIIFVVSIGVSLLETCARPEEVLKEAAFNAAWVFAAGLITEALLPFLERYCGILTPMRLVEMGNTNHPVLRTLYNRAPATYNHSIATSVIAENAAKEIGARTGLVRVGAYFHDIGKALRPEYFTENQIPGEDPHEGLKPKKSAEIIISHIKDGVSMAENTYKLPRQVVDLIRQHHGTFPVTYFYEKAKAESERSGEPEIPIAEFRYPGPIPQTKEAAILMIADAVESASRSIKDADKGKIRNMLHNIVQRRIDDGQFNDCGLTLSEIQKIEASMLTTALSMNHQRIKYPGQDEIDKISGEAKSADGAKPRGPEVKKEESPAKEK